MTVNNNVTQNAGRILGLSLLLMMLFSMDFLNFSITFDVGLAPYLFIMTLFDTIAISYMVQRSRWGGWKLIASVFTIFYGLRTLLTQVETLVFVPELTSLVPGILFNDAVTIFIFSIVCVYSYGKQAPIDGVEKDNKLDLPWSHWIWKPALISISYLAIYILFGLYVFKPIANLLDPTTLLSYYDGVTVPNYVILQLQLVRGLGFLVITLPIIKLIKGSWGSTGLAVALMFSLIMGGNLIIPVAAIPQTMRYAHFIEVFSENFVFGFILVAILKIRSNGINNSTKENRDNFNG